uniref:DNA-directed RNA polymerase n=1 Tax=Arabidopsis thaliana TaxID=3702 RepID=Q9FWB0_ARATH|nr:mitochondrial single-subunit DNA-dependent RNA polymerase, putative; 6999-7354 [Arabidopsis thaliana]
MFIVGIRCCQPKEHDTFEDDSLTFHASCYVAKITLKALEGMFEAARAIKSWFGNCARAIKSWFGDCTKVTSFKNN